MGHYQLPKPSCISAFWHARFDFLARLLNNMRPLQNTAWCLTFSHSVDYLFGVYADEFNLIKYDFIIENMYSQIFSSGKIYSSHSGNSTRILRVRKREVRALTFSERIYDILNSLYKGNIACLFPLYRSHLLDTGLIRRLSFRCINWNLHLHLNVLF